MPYLCIYSQLSFLEGTASENAVQEFVNRAYVKSFYQTEKSESENRHSKTEYKKLSNMDKILNSE